MTYRSGKGKFVPRSNPCAVAAIVNGRNQREAAAAVAVASLEAARRRQHLGRRNGYTGPLTRAELAAMAAGTGRAA